MDEEPIPDRFGIQNCAFGKNGTPRRHNRKKISNALDISASTPQVMFYEKLALEVNAQASGLTVVRPATMRGESGNDQKFSVMATGNGQTFAFDICQQISEEQVLRTYMKQLDTGARTFIVSLGGRPSPLAVELAQNYGIGMLGPGDVGEFFSKRLLPQAATSKLAYEALA